jgi:hypothetical protein
MRYMMYKVNYGDTALAREKFAELPASVREELARRSLEPAEQACPQRLPISRIVEQALQQLA